MSWKTYLSKLTPPLILASVWQSGQNIPSIFPLQSVSNKPCTSNRESHISGGMSELADRVWVRERGTISMCHTSVPCNNGLYGLNFLSMSLTLSLSLSFSQCTSPYPFPHYDRTYSKRDWIFEDSKRDMIFSCRHWHPIPNLSKKGKKWGLKDGMVSLREEWRERWSLLQKFSWRVEN